MPHSMFRCWHIQVPVTFGFPREKVYLPSRVNTSLDRSETFFQCCKYINYLSILSTLFMKIYKRKLGSLPLFKPTDLYR